MNAKQCDRCGSFYSICDGLQRPIYREKRIYGMQITTANQNVVNYYDLCPNCAHDLITFLKEKRESQSEKEESN